MGRARKLDYDLIREYYSKGMSAAHIARTMGETEQAIGYVIRKFAGDSKEVALVRAKKLKAEEERSVYRIQEATNDMYGTLLSLQDTLVDALQNENGINLNAVNSLNGVIVNIRGAIDLAMKQLELINNKFATDRRERILVDILKATSPMVCPSCKAPFPKFLLYETFKQRVKEANVAIPEIHV